MSHRAVDETGEAAFPPRIADLGLAALIAFLAFWIYSPAANGDWIWDDSLYVSDNPLLREPGRLWKAWFVHGSFVEYYPIEQTLQWFQWSLWGNNTLPYHLTNVALHVVDALLVWRLLEKLGLRFGWVGAVLFVVHPIMVESVAWISEFKNTLSLAPCLLALCAWIDYDREGGSRDYARALAWFVVALLCKIGVAPVAGTLLLYAWWLRGRIGWRDILVTAPFLLMAIGLSVLNVWTGAVYIASQSKVWPVIDIGGPLAQFVLAGQCLAFYFTRFFWPLGPMPIYPQWTVDPASPAPYAPWFLMALAMGALWLRRATWGRHALLGLGFFAMTLVPVIGFVPISYLSFTWVMDHLAYVPSIGLIGLVVAGIEQIDGRVPVALHPVSTGIFTGIMVLLAWESHWYASAFTNDETLWTYAVERNPNAYSAQDSLGKILLKAGEPAEARTHFQTAVQLRPGLGELYDDLGTAYAAEGRFPEALTAYAAALQRDPYSPETHNNLGIVLAQTGHVGEALLHFQQALHKHPAYVDAHVNYANALMVTGHLPEGIAQYQAALALNPACVPAHDGLGFAYLQSGRTSDAMREFEAALALDPNDGKARDNLLRLQGQGK